MFSLRGRARALASSLAACLVGLAQPRVALVLRQCPHLCATVGLYQASGSRRAFAAPAAAVLAFFASPRGGTANHLGTAASAARAARRGPSFGWQQRPVYWPAITRPSKCLATAPRAPGEGAGLESLTWSESPRRSLLRFSSSCRMGVVAILTALALAQVAVAMARDAVTLPWRAAVVERPVCALHGRMTGLAAAAVSRSILGIETGAFGAASLVAQPPLNSPHYSRRGRLPSALAGTRLAALLHASDPRALSVPAARAPCFAQGGARGEPRHCPRCARRCGH